MAADQPAITQGQFGATLRRHRLLILLCTALATAAGLAYGLLGATSYTASASVLVTPLEGNPYSPVGRGDDLLNLETEAQLVKTDAVAKLARDRMRVSTFPGELRSRVSVQVPPNTQVLNISYTTSGAAAARNGAQTFAESYLEYRRQRTQNVLDGKLKKLNDQSRRVEQSLQNATKELQAATGARRSFLNNRIEGYTNQLSVIEEQTNDVRSTPINPGQVITPAAQPGGAGLQRPAMYGVGGLIAGLAAGVGLALWRQRRDRRLFDADDVERLGVPVLSTLHRPGPGEGALALVTAPRGNAGDAYRRLRAAIVANAPTAPVTLLVTSATPGRTASLVSSNLAVALAFAGSATILIDAATCDVDPAPLFGLRQAKGLSNALVMGGDPGEMLVHVDSQLRLLPRGSNPREAAHRFSGPRMRETIRVLRKRAGFLVINADGISDADAQALCVLADAVVIIVTPRVTTRDELEQAYAEAERARTRVIGVVVDAPPPRSKKGRTEQPEALPGRRRAALTEAGGDRPHPPSFGGRQDEPEQVDQADQEKQPKPAVAESSATASKPDKEDAPYSDDETAYWPGLPAASPTADTERATEAAKSEPGA